MGCLKRIVDLSCFWIWQLWMCANDKPLSGWDELVGDKSGEQSERGKVKLCRLWTRSPDSWASFLFLSCSLLHTRTYNTTLMFQRDKNSSLFLGGERTTGQDVRSSNGRWLIHFWCSLSLIRLCSTCCCIDCQHCKEFFGSCGSWQDACRRDWCK